MDTSHDRQTGEKLDPHKQEPSLQLASDDQQATMHLLEEGKNHTAFEIFREARRRI